MRRSGFVFGGRSVFWLWSLLWWPALVCGGPLLTLRGHLPPADAVRQPLGDLSTNAMLHLAIALPLHHQDALTNLLAELYDPASPVFRHFLTPKEFTARFGPTEAEYAQVIHFAHTSGFTVAGTFSNRAVVEVYGRVSAVERAFHVRMKRYRHPGEARDFYAPEVEPTVGTNLPVLFVGGLNSYRLPQPASLHFKRLTSGNGPVANGGSGADGLYAGQDFRGAYAAGLTNTGAGQSVGLVEFDSYYSSDINEYLAYPGIGLTNVSVTLSNVVVGDLTGSPGSGNLEVALDIEMAISMAPGLSTIYVYEATNGDAASPDLLLNRMVSDNLSRQLSCSWSGFNDATVESDLAEFATQGQSFFQASGDSGAYVSRHNPVQPPCDNPNITVVGGTTLNTTGPGGSWVSETTWSWFPSQDNATSGGVSTSWPLPTWQSGINMSTNGGSTSHRNLPDVALTANQIFVIANDGGEYSVGGTSAATPLWAGLTALLNQRLTVQDQPPPGFMNPALYAIAQGSGYSYCFHDITVGNNTNRYTAKDFFAEPGYDLCTGWGTPIGQALVDTLAPEPLAVSPTAGFNSSGPYGGPFTTATNEVFTLTNVAASAFSWGISASAPWVSASSSGGTLAPAGVAAAVTVSLNPNTTALAAGTHTNTISFTDLSDNVVQSRQIIVTISPATPVVTWSKPAAITYGTSLSPVQLNATTTVPGSFTYSPPSGTVLQVGTNQLVAVFTPTDTTDYNSSTSTVSLVVSPAALVVTAAATNRVYGQANPVFQGTVTGLQNGDNLTAAFSCSATVLSPVGTYPIVPSLVDPANLETNYTVTLNTGLLTVAQAPVTVVWTNPAPITEGTALTTAQLDATANVAGSFAYNPPLGAIPPAGTNTLTAIFTPEDSLDYRGATNTVVLVVAAQAVMEGDTPLFPGWGAPVMLAGMAALGAAFLHRRAVSIGR